MNGNHQITLQHNPNLFQRSLSLPVLSTNTASLDSSERPGDQKQITDKYRLKITKLSNLLDKERSENALNMHNLSNTFQSDKLALQYELQKLEQSNRTLQQQLQDLREYRSNKKALLKQQNNLLEAQLLETKSQLDQERQHFSQTLMTIRGETSPELTQQINSIHTNFINQISNLHQQRKDTEKNLIQQLTDHKKTHEKIDLENKILIADLKSSIQNLTQDLNFVTAERDQFKNQLKDLKLQSGNAISLTNHTKAKEVEAIQALLDQAHANHNAEITKAFHDRENLVNHLTSHFNSQIIASRNQIQNYKTQMEEQQVLFEQHLKDVREECDSKLAESEEYAKELDQYYIQEISILNSQIDKQSYKIQLTEQLLEEAQTKLNDTIFTHNQELDRLRELNRQQTDSLLQQISHLKTHIETLETTSNKTNNQIHHINNTVFYKATLKEKNKTILNLEKQHNQLKQKIEQLTYTNNELEQALQKQISDSASPQIDYSKKNTEERAKKEQDLNLKMVKDAEMWEKKCKAAIEQRDMLSKELCEYKQNLTSTVSGILSITSSHDSNSSLLSSIQENYDQILRQKEQSYKKSLEAANSANQQLETALQSSHTQLQLERLNNSSQILSLQEKVQNLSQKETKLLNDIDILKRDRDAKIEEIKMALTHEISLLKSKLAQSDTKLKELLLKNNEYLVELEKEKVRYNIEKENLIREKDEASEEAKTLKVQLQTQKTIVTQLKSRYQQHSSSSSRFRFRISPNLSFEGSAKRSENSTFASPTSRSFLKRVNSDFNYKV